MTNLCRKCAIETEYTEEIEVKYPFMLKFLFSFQNKKKKKEMIKWELTLFPLLSSAYEAIRDIADGCFILNRILIHRNSWRRWGGRRGRWRGQAIHAETFLHGHGSMMTHIRWWRHHEMMMILMMKLDTKEPKPNMTNTKTCTSPSEIRAGPWIVAYVSTMWALSAHFHPDKNNDNIIKCLPST